MSYSERFDQALLLAHQLHRHQVRKSTQVPYVTHLLSVAALVGEAGGSEDQVIAALLHDAVEDQGGPETGRLIRERFGDRVADIVDACSDTDQDPKPPWQPRKEQYLAALPHKSPEALLVSLADKLHNCRTLVLDLRVEGTSVFLRFAGRQGGTLWYYRSLVEVFRALLSHPLVEELDRTVTLLEQLTESAPQRSPQSLRA